MQTFVPCEEGFGACAAVLDRQRLGKQRLEVVQILKTLLGRSTAWAQHPAVLMWQGHERALADYGIAICEEWVRRNYHDTQERIIESLRDIAPPLSAFYPAWWGGPIHASHRANLLRKDAKWYRQFGWRESPEMNYFWPVKAP